MEELLNFIPEMKDIFITRYEILEFIIQEKSVGRRKIASRLFLSERIVRDEIEFLKRVDLVVVEPAGVKPTKRGIEIERALRDFYLEAASLKLLQEELKNFLGLKAVYVVRGDVSKNEEYYVNLGDACVDYIGSVAKEDDIIGVTGGRTLREVANRARDLKLSHLMVVPARGSLGKIPMYQANTVAALMAEGFKAKYNLLAVPDVVDEKTLKLLLKNEEVREVYDLVRHIDILVFGIGRADVMSEKRSLSKEKRDEIINLGAVGEAFGHYFDIEGKEIYSQESFGISKEEFLKIKDVVAVAGGCDKAEAIMSIAKLRSNMVLVTDEGLAREVLNRRTK